MRKDNSKLLPVEKYLLEHYDAELILLVLQGMDESQQWCDPSDAFVEAVLKYGDDRAVSFLMASPVLLSEDVVCRLIEQKDIPLLFRFVSGNNGHPPYRLQDKNAIALIKLGHTELTDAYFGYWGKVALEGYEIRTYLEDSGLIDEFQKRYGAF